MGEFFHGFLAWSPFIPHGHCYLWKTGLVSLHVASDSIIALAYYSIPIGLVYLASQRKDLPFNWIFLLFSSFIVLCGTTHIMDVWTLWHPTYWISGYLKLLTAGVSAYTAIICIALIPKALLIPSTTQIEAINHQLQNEIASRQLIEAEIENSYKLLQTVLEGTPDPIFVKDLQGRYLMLNSAFAQVFNCTIDEILGQDDTQLLSPELLKVIRETDREVITTGKTKVLEEEVANKIYLSTKSPYRDVNGEIIGLIGVARDITERKHVEEILKKSNEQLEINVEQRTQELQKVIAQLQQENIERQETEEALKQSQQQLKDILDNSIAVIYLKDAEGRYILVNRQFTNLFHISQAEIQGKTEYELFPKALADDFRANDIKVLESGKAIKLEETVPHDDGLHTYISVKFPLYDSAGVPCAVCGISTDITSHKRAEEALRQSEERYRSLTVATSQIVWTTDESGLVIDMPQWRLYTGQTVAEVKGYGWLNAIHPDDRDRVEQQWINTVATKNLYETEYRIRASDGNYRHFSVRGIPVLTEDRSIREWVGICTDIHDSKIAQEVLRENEEYFRATFEQAAVGICHCGMNGEFLKINQKFCDIVGYSEAELLERTFADLIHPDDLTLDLEKFQALMSGKVPTYQMEKRYLAQSGKVIWVNMNVSIVRSSDGTPKYKVAVIQDISEQQEALRERKRAEQELRESETRFRELAQRAELLNRVAQQIRNSLEVDTILETAVQEIRALLKIERCTFTEFQLHTSPPTFTICKEANAPHLCSYLGQYPLNLEDSVVQKLLNLEVLRFDDLLSSTDPVVQRLQHHWGCRSLVMLPIKTLSGDISSFTCIQESEVRPWSEWEMELLTAVTAQFAIAISQAELYTQSRTKAKELEQALKELKSTQAQLIQTEKMSSLGQLVAGIAHEINNPVNFIYGNLTHIDEYTQDLLSLLNLYQQHNQKPLAEIQSFALKIDLDYLLEDLPKLLNSMKLGATRIRDIVLSLRNFSRLDEAEIKVVDVHEGIESTLLILQNRLKAKSHRSNIELIKEYGDLPLVECYPSQLNQALMNVLNNAIDALEEKFKFASESQDSPTIKLWTELETLPLSADQTSNRQPPIQWAAIHIADNGLGMSEETRSRLFDPFFTTKPIGSGTGLGMSISYQIIVEKHKGDITCVSELGKGAEFTIKIPLKQYAPNIQNPNASFPSALSAS